jgi:hypothetical protein
MFKLPTRLWPKGQKWAEYNEIVPPGTPLSAILSREYWIHVQNQIRPFDTISCVAEDGSFDVDIRLIRKTPTEMVFRVIRDAGIASADAITRDEATARYVVQPPVRGKPGMWQVRERSSGIVVADGLDKDTAERERVKLEEAA